ncbi:hypothetical protein [Aliidiomarina sanyensis]|uniref:Uncharacterized protein n=1 Tax=Aliidiomarina sanyensis TaxID=1249555 RepID=A0A432WBC7_9GAMM|nr:hypothetical protein [Aliidiomarina sanyensis]RUO28186.1 hypothetical protein CWE11_10785 [Aliidiomarina sanyensis]
MSQSKIHPRTGIAFFTRHDLMTIENLRLRGKVESQRAQMNELRRQLTESEERNAHSNAMLRRATRLLDEVVYSKQQSSELIEEVEQLRQISAGGDL